jgi:hypothetical protein
VTAPVAAPSLASPGEYPVPVAAFAPHLSERAFPSASNAAGSVLYDIRIFDSTEGQLSPTAEAD